MMITPQQDNDQILLELYCEISQFLQTFQPIYEQHLLGEKRQRPFCRLGLCEIMTILVAYQIIGGQNFKQFYLDVILQFHKKEFPNWVSYSRFVEIAPMALIPLTLFLQFRLEMSEHTNLYVIDSTPLAVCHNRRIPRHRTFEGLARRGKTSMGWFYGFKLHLVINHLGELVNVHISAGNLDDRKVLPHLVNQLKGKLLGDKGYIKKELAQQLWDQGLELITTLKKKMKQLPPTGFNRLLLRKRAVVETVNDLLKNYFQIEHSRHRSVVGFMNNLLAGLIAYTFYPKKPEMRGLQTHNDIVLQ